MPFVNVGILAFHWENEITFNPSPFYYLVNLVPAKVNIELRPCHEYLKLEVYESFFAIAISKNFTIVGLNTFKLFFG